MQSSTNMPLLRSYINFLALKGLNISAMGEAHRDRTEAESPVTAIFSQEGVINSHYLPH